MKAELFFKALIKYLLGVLIVGALVFIPAGTLNFTKGIVFMCLLFIPMFIAGIVMLIKNPELLKKRLNAKETEKEQKEVILVSALMFIAGFIVAGLNFRFGWKEIPTNIWIFSIVVFVVSYLMYAEVLRENEYLSRTIEVTKDQKVIDTGLYGIVRHPMYAATVLLFMSMPIVLGSIYSFIIFFIYPYIISRRIKNEEEFLDRNLIGYRQYKQKVKYKIIPFIW